MPSFVKWGSIEMQKQKCEREHSHPHSHSLIIRYQAWQGSTVHPHLHEKVPGGNDAPMLSFWKAPARMKGEDCAEDIDCHACHYCHFTRQNNQRHGIPSRKTPPHTLDVTNDPRSLTPPSHCPFLCQSPACSPLSSSLSSPFGHTQ